MRVLVIGAAGQLGTDVCDVFRDSEVVGADLSGAQLELDIRDGAAIHRLIGEEHRPDVVVNAAAAHHLPRCEKEPELAFAVNAVGPLYIARACREIDARLVHISTDYVFGSGGTRPYRETDLPAPLSVYGASKLGGEHSVRANCGRHFIVRTSALYGHAPCRAKGGRNFVQLMRHLAATEGKVKVVTDEIVSPTYTRTLARQIRRLVEHDRPGLYHATSQGQCSWYKFAQAIFQETRTEVSMEKARSADFPSPARRPDYSVLENAALRKEGIDIMPGWREGLVEYLSSE